MPIDDPDALDLAPLGQLAAVYRQAYALARRRHDAEVERDPSARMLVFDQGRQGCPFNPREWPAFEAWTSVVRTLSRTEGGPAKLDALVTQLQPVSPQPA